ncbi:hypothetical protein [Elioraea sp.]|uniref:hypothetical protein n=1 Tax=Elioraea sp. TaxID=2185103 RepID=UPI0025BE0CDA|nr:hypothetical protein [Elioraea sp.]
MARNTGRNDDAAMAATPQLPAALMAMTLHMVESRVALMSALSRCGTAMEAGEAMTRWMGRRVAEFGEDQARVTEALFTGFAQAMNAATNTATDAATAALTAATDGKEKSNH